MLRDPNLLKNFSAERFSSYLEMASSDDFAALALYEFNIKLSESFYPPLHNLEISLRNKFHLAIAEIYGEKWFLNRDLLAGTSGGEFVNVARIHEVMTKTKSNEACNVISNLSFGFWVSLLYRNYEIGLWRPCLRKIFPAQQAVTRKEIQHKLAQIKAIRNRTAHHEFILKHDLKLYHRMIYEMLEHLSPELADWTSRLDRFPRIFLEYQQLLAKIGATKNPGDLQVEVGPGHLGDFWMLVK